MATTAHALGASSSIHSLTVMGSPVAGSFPIDVQSPSQLIPSEIHRMWTSSTPDFVDAIWESSRLKLRRRDRAGNEASGAADAPWAARRAATIRLDPTRAAA